MVVVVLITAKVQILSGALFFLQALQMFCFFHAFA